MGVGDGVSVGAGVLVGNAVTVCATDVITRFVTCSELFLGCPIPQAIINNVVVITKAIFCFTDRFIRFSFLLSFEVSTARLTQTKRTFSDHLFPQKVFKLAELYPCGHVQVQWRYRHFFLRPQDVNIGIFRFIGNVFGKFIQNRARLIP